MAPSVTEHRSRPSQNIARQLSSTAGSARIDSRRSFRSCARRREAYRLVHDVPTCRCAAARSGDRRCPRRVAGRRRDFRSASNGQRSRTCPHTCGTGGWLSDCHVHGSGRGRDIGSHRDHGPSSSRWSVPPHGARRHVHDRSSRAFWLSVMLRAGDVRGARGQEDRGDLREVHGRVEVSVLPLGAALHLLPIPWTWPSPPGYLCNLFAIHSVKGSMSGDGCGSGPAHFGASPIARRSATGMPSPNAGFAPSDHGTARMREVSHSATSCSLHVPPATSSITRSASSTDG